MSGRWNKWPEVKPKKRDIKDGYASEVLVKWVDYWHIHERYGIVSYDKMELFNGIILAWKYIIPF